MANLVLQHARFVSVQCIFTNLSCKCTSVCVIRNKLQLYVSSLDSSHRDQESYSIYNCSFYSPWMSLHNMMSCVTALAAIRNGTFCSGECTITSYPNTHVYPHGFDVFKNSYCEWNINSLIQSPREYHTIKFSASSKTGYVGVCCT